MRRAVGEFGDCCHGPVVVLSRLSRGVSRARDTPRPAGFVIRVRDSRSTAAFGALMAGAVGLKGPPGMVQTLVTWRMLVDIRFRLLAWGSGGCRTKVMGPVD